MSASLKSNQHGVDRETRVDLYLFGPMVVKIQQRVGVWQLTPHGLALGEGMVAGKHALIGKSGIEIGAGTGVHAIAALKLGTRTIDVTDIDVEALESARENASLNGVQYRRSLQRDWLNLTPDETYDFVLCNPPFCKAGTQDRRHFISELIKGSPGLIGSGGHLMFVQSSMADFALSEKELRDTGFSYSVILEKRNLFRSYYFDEPGFIEESSHVEQGFEEIDGTYVETLRVYLCTLK